MPQLHTSPVASVRAPAKVNLYLGVHNQTDQEGYHRVDSVMAALSLADRVTLTPSDGLHVSMTAADKALEPLPTVPEEENSAWRAARAMADVFGRDARFHIHIEKHIPLQAGLGGPSADAAAVIYALAGLWGLDRADGRILAVARSLGADVPFFLGGSPAYLSGRGDELEEAFPQAACLPVALVKPQAAGVSTPAAYRRFDEAPLDRAPLEPLLRELRGDGAPAAAAGDRARRLAALVSNNLAGAACALEPRVGKILAWLDGQPETLAATVCGSGSCCFALCVSDAAAARLAARAARSAGAGAPDEHVAPTGACWWSCATRMENCGVRAST